MIQSERKRRPAAHTDMKIILTGPVNRYYVQTLCMLYFPGAKFSEHEDAFGETPVVRVTGVMRETGFETTVEISIDGCGVSHTHLEPKRDGISEEKLSRLSLGVAFFRAGEKMFGYTPSWGILTGVRPSKIATKLLHKGLDRDGICRRLTQEYFISPKKAALAADVVLCEEKIIRTLPERSCSVYISIPFCPSRCAYCSFVSYSTKRLLSMIPDYLERLYYDIDRIFDTVTQLGFAVTTVYVGGGTPTVLTAEQLAVLLDRVNRRLDRTHLAEFTVEAGRPDTVTAEKLKVLYDAGVDRISINPQTLNDRVLETIGRRHTADDFRRAFALARESGIPCINTDLIAGLPTEDFASFSRSVDTILALRPENFTVHTFCVKKSADILKSETEIYSRTGGDAGKSVDYSQFRAKTEGYHPYYMYRQKNSVGNFENVGFSLDGFDGRYNIFIMEELHSIFAAGAGGVTKVMHTAQDINRLFMPKYPYEYLSQDRKEAMDAYQQKIYDYFNGSAAQKSE